MNGEEGGWASTQPLQLPPASGSVPSHEVGAARSAGFSIQTLPCRARQNGTGSRRSGRHTLPRPHAAVFTAVR